MTFVGIDSPNRLFGRFKFFENGHQLTRSKGVIEVKIGQLADAHAVQRRVKDGMAIVAAPDRARAIERFLALIGKVPERRATDQAIMLIQVSDFSRSLSTRQIARSCTGPGMSRSDLCRNQIGRWEIASADSEVTPLSYQVHRAVCHIQVNGDLAVLLGKLSSNRSDVSLSQRKAAGEPEVSPRSTLIAYQLNGFVSIAYQAGAVV